MRRSRHCFSSPEILFRYLSNSFFCFLFLQTWEISSCTSHAPEWPACQAFLQPPWRASTAIGFPTLCLPAEQHVLHDEATDNTWNSPTVALWILLFQCFQKAWRWCPPQTGTPQSWSCTESPHWKLVLNYKQTRFRGTHKPRPDIYLEAWECLMAVGHLRWLKGRGSLCEQTIERLLDSDEKWFELRWGLIWKGLL